VAITATYLRLLREVSDSGAFPWSELFAQLALIAGAAIGMEFYARYAHKFLWHDSLWTMELKSRKEWNRPIWMLHESHHLPREGQFEANDIFALANGVPAFALCAYGFLTPGVFGGLCFGAGLGITFFGIAYMYVHDGMVHKRFPTGPLGKLPFLRKIAAGHTIHHTEAFDGVPWGLFLSTQELSNCAGGLEELEAVVDAAERKTAREEEEAEAKAMAAEAAGLEVEPEYVSPFKSGSFISEGVHIPSLTSPPSCTLRSGDE
jgi:beta-carotene 3-hydroxylase